MFSETRDHPKLIVSLIIRRPFSTSGASHLICADFLRSNRSYLQSPHASARRSSPSYAASAFCVRGFTSTLEPAICARKKEADIECVSPTGRVLAQSLVMRGDFFDNQAVIFGFHATSRHCIPRLSPRNSNLNAITANNGAAENCSGRQRVSRWLLPAEPAAQPARHAPPPSAVSELESLGD